VSGTAARPAARHLREVGSEAVVEAMLRGPRESAPTARMLCKERSGQKETGREEPIPVDRRINVAGAPYDVGARRHRRCPGCVRLVDVALGGVVPPSFPTQAGTPP
jgi:hypothetical protein